MRQWVQSQRPFVLAKDGKGDEFVFVSVDEYCHLLYKKGTIKLEWAKVEDIETNPHLHEVPKDEFLLKDLFHLIPGFNLVRQFYECGITKPSKDFYDLYIIVLYQGEYYLLYENGKITHYDNYPLLITSEVPQNSLYYTEYFDRIPGFQSQSIPCNCPLNLIMSVGCKNPQHV